MCPRVNTGRLLVLGEIRHGRRHDPGGTVGAEPARVRGRRQDHCGQGGQGDVDGKDAARAADDLGRDGVLPRDPRPHRVQPVEGERKAHRDARRKPSGFIYDLNITTACCRHVHFSLRYFLRNALSPVEMKREHSVPITSYRKIIVPMSYRDFRASNTATNNISFGQHNMCV